MNTTLEAGETTRRYARAIAASKRIRWDIERDVIRGGFSSGLQRMDVGRQPGAYSEGSHASSVAPRPMPGPGGL